MQLSKLFTLDLSKIRGKFVFGIKNSIAEVKTQD